MDRTPTLFLLLLLPILLLPDVALARSTAPPPSQTRPVAALAILPTVTVPGPLATAPPPADRDGRYGGAPLQFAVPQPVNVHTANAGLWETLPDGARLWRLRLSAPGATDVNLAFAGVALPAGATLHIVSETTGYYQGPYTAADNRPHGELWTPVLPGDRVVVELYLPPGVALPQPLWVMQLGAGFLDVFARGLTAKSGSCNNMTACSAALPWQDEIRSVARYSRNGSFLCTGTLLMDTARSFTPYFLTATHCGVTAANDHTVVVYWNHDAPTCEPGGQIDGNLDDNQTGSYWRAGRSDVDITLLELIERPDPAFNVHWSGWDRAGVAATGSVGIHHPRGHAKAISFNDNPLTTTDNCIGGGIDTHWRVDDWEDGTTEGGSAGSGLWDSLTHRLVGTLSGGVAACPDNNGSDCYGKFALAWNGSSRSQRLRDWLDPLNTGLTGIDGSDLDPALFSDGFED